MRVLRSFAALTTLVCVALALSAGTAAAKTTDAEVLKGLEGLVTSPGGPPGAIATLYRDGKLTTLSIGLADIERKGAPRATNHMRIARSRVSKTCFAGARFVPSGPVSEVDRRIR